MRNLLLKGPGFSGQIKIDEEPLGRGGEGSVFSIIDHNVNEIPPAKSLVVKIYHDPSENNRLAKVKGMIESIPKDSSVAWPLALVFNQDQTFAGYIMNKLDKDSYRPWSDLAHAQTRRGTSSSFDVRYAIASIRNLAVAIHSVHEAGHKVGDVNESNIFCGTDASVLLVDTDSAQIKARDGQIFRCLVGKPEYTAPEISNGPLKDQDRTIETDMFAFCVAAYQMLTGGAHPTDSIFLGEEDPPSTIQKIRLGIFPGLVPPTKPGFKHPPRISVEGIPSIIKKFLVRGLSIDPRNRPTFVDLIAGLDNVQDNLVECQKHPYHWIDKRDGACGWCAHADRGQPDPWAEKSASQQSNVKLNQKALPSVSFNDSDGQVQIRRAPPMRAGSQNPPVNQFPVSPSYTQPLSYQTPSVPNPNYSPQQPSQQQSQQPPPAGMPRAKNGKTILTYANGSQRVRPGWVSLWRQNKSLAISCFKNECPDSARFWWPTDRDLGSRQALQLGLIVSFLMAGIWVTVTPTIVSQYASDQALNFAAIGGLFAAMGTVFAGFFLTMSGLLDRSKTKRRYGSLDNFKQEDFQKTIRRYFILAFVYGPLLVVITTYLVIYGIILFVFEIIKSSK